MMITFSAQRGRLVTLVDGFPDEEFLPEAVDHFYSTQRDVQVAFLKDGAGEVSGIRWKEDGRDRKVPRIGPLFHLMKPQADPEPARTEQVAAALKALGQGGKALADSPWLTPGARDDLGAIHDPALAGIQSLVFLAEQDTHARDIERHKGRVSRILYYRLKTDKGDRCLLIHLAADGKITDYDIVED
jgi:hypothetical protein